MYSFHAICNSCACVWHKQATNRLQIRRSSRDCHFNTLRSNYAACAGGEEATRVARLKVVAYVGGARREGIACPSLFVRLTFCIIKSVAACRQLRTKVDSTRVSVDCCQRLKLPQRGHRMQCILSSSSSCQCSVMQQAEVKLAKGKLQTASWQTGNANWALSQKQFASACTCMDV